MPATRPAMRQIVVNKPSSSRLSRRIAPKTISWHYVSIKVTITGFLHLVNSARQNRDSGALSRLRCLCFAVPGGWGGGLGERDDPAKQQTEYQGQEREPQEWHERRDDGLRPKFVAVEMARGKDDQAPPINAELIGNRKL